MAKSKHTSLTHPPCHTHTAAPTLPHPHHCRTHTADKSVNLQQTDDYNRGCLPGGVVDARGVDIYGVDARVDARVDAYVVDTCVGSRYWLTVESSDLPGKEDRSLPVQVCLFKSISLEGTSSSTLPSPVPLVVAEA